MAPPTAPAFGDLRTAHGRDRRGRRRIHGLACPSPRLDHLLASSAPTDLVVLKTHAVKQTLTNSIPKSLIDDHPPPQNTEEGESRKRGEKEQEADRTKTLS
ncbi:hypothetical protein BHM03_00002637 [Ensete ventricosum]|nr:hypothetical protein BHM03_00002637 [Ensete ventricosum]